MMVIRLVLTVKNGNKKIVNFASCILHPPGGDRPMHGALTDEMCITAVGCL